MDFIIDFILHIDHYMVEMVQQYHTWTYAILFAVIFCETGLVVTPFLPGDSLLFVGGRHCRCSLRSARCQFIVPDIVCICGLRRFLQLYDRALFGKTTVS